MNKNYYNLTGPQKNIWLVDTVNDNNINNISGIFYVYDNNFNYDIHNSILNKLIKENDAIRIRMELVNGETMQYFQEYQAFQTELVDMTNVTESNIKKYLKKQREIKVDILGKELYDFKIIKYKDKTGIFYKFHHIVADAWSLIQFASQYAKTYENINSREKIDIEKRSYIEYINTEEDYYNSAKYESDKTFWKDYLKDVNESVSLKSLNSKISNEAKRYKVKLEKSFNNKLNEFCKENKVSSYALFMTALSVYLHRILEKDDFVIGTPVLNRSNFREKQIIGMFISTIPLRIKIKEEATFIELARDISSNLMSIYRHQRFPYAAILEDVYKSSKINKNLYNISLSYQNARADYPNNKKYKAIWEAPMHIQNDIDIHVVDINNNGRLEIYYDYLVKLFGSEEIEFIHKRLTTILNQIIDNKNKRIEKAKIISIDEKNILAKKFNNTKSNYNKEKSTVELFEQKVKEEPQKIALCFAQKKFTYLELNEKANQIAHGLIKDVSVGDTVAILMKRNELLIPTFIAILKCGATYIPIDPEYPIERVNYILEDSKAKCIVTDEEKVNIQNSKVININTMNYEKHSKTDLKLKLSIENLAYIIYTSGSTGNPKGVMISNKNLINFLFGINKEVKLNADNNIVSITTISFDIFGLEIWLTLIIGATLVLASEHEQIDAKLLNELCIKNNVDVIQTTPTKLRLLTSNKESIKYIKQMKKILLGGESLPEEFINNLKKMTKATIYNVYGPTETTIWSTVKDISDRNYITAGKPIQNTEIYILDKKNRILPIGAAGQLAISGDSVSVGYYNNESLTKEKFIYSKEVGKTLYLTGDLAVIDFNSEIKILGRLDFQIKINGQRIELEEIENKISKYNNIKEVIVVLKDNSKLVCFYSLKDINIKIQHDKLTEYLQTVLPIYMVPSMFKEIEEFPLTNNSKIDRKELLKYDISLYEQQLILPQNIMQQKIYDSWKEIIENEKMGIDSNFFAVGDSLDAIKLKIELMKSNINVEYADIFKFPTIRKLAQHLENNEERVEFDIRGYKNDFSEILNKNKMTIKANNRINIGNVLLTGSTGFLGAHIVEELLKKEKIIIYCLIRKKNNIDVNERLKQTLNYFFGSKYDNLIGERVIAIEGDICEEDLGIENYKEITSNIDFVIHSAACVKHYGDKQYFFDINVKATENIANYCLKEDKKMIHISTLSVSGNAFESARIEQTNDKETIFDETCFYKGQNVNNVYTYTKFKAEESVLKYMEKGLQANIIRCGNLTGRYSDLKFQNNVEDNGFVNRIKSIINIGAIPKNCYDMYLEFTPIDLISEFIVKVMQNFNINNNMFHAFNHNHVYIKDFLIILKDMGINIDVIEEKEFSHLINKIMQNSKNEEKILGIINDLNEDNVIDYSTNIKIKSDITINYLKSIGFEWKKIDKKYIVKFIKYLIKIKFIK